MFTKFCLTQARHSSWCHALTEVKFSFFGLFICDRLLWLFDITLVLPPQRIVSESLAVWGDWLPLVNFKFQIPNSIILHSVTKCMWSAVKFACPTWRTLSLHWATLPLLGWPDRVLLAIFSSDGHLPLISRFLRHSAIMSCAYYEEEFKFRTIYKQMASTS